MTDLLNAIRTGLKIQPDTVCVRISEADWRKIYNADPGISGKVKVDKTLVLPDLTLGDGVVVFDKEWKPFA